MLLDEAGEVSSIAELVDRFADQGWICEITDLHVEEKLAADAAGAVRYYPRGLNTDEPVETGEGQYVVVVEGDLVTTGHIGVDTDDYVQGRVIVTGNLRAGSLSFANGARLAVEGSAHIASACVGQYGDRNAVLGVGGELSVPLVALDSNTGAFADGGIRALIYADLGWWHELKPDILLQEDDDRFFPAELLDSYGTLDLDKVIEAARAGAPLLKPGVAELFPASSRYRSTA